MTSIIQIAETQYRTVDSNSLTISGDIGVIDEYVPFTEPDKINDKSGRRKVVIDLNNIKTIEVDAKSTVTAKTVTSMVEAIDKINKE